MANPSILILAGDGIGPEIFDAAAQVGAQVFYEAAVAGAIPLLRPLRESLAGDKVRRLLGIVNGTTNSYLQRLNASGSGDQTFTTVPLGAFSAFRALRVLSDGRIMVATVNSGFAIQRVTSAGLYDVSFTALANSTITPGAIAFTSDGRTWLGGTFSTLASPIPRGSRSRRRSRRPTPGGFNRATKR